MSRSQLWNHPVCSIYRQMTPRMFGKLIFRIDHLHGSNQHQKITRLHIFIFLADTASMVRRPWYFSRRKWTILDFGAPWRSHAPPKRVFQDSKGVWGNPTFVSSQLWVRRSLVGDWICEIRHIPIAGIAWFWTLEPHGGRICPRNLCFLALELFGVTPLYFPVNSWAVAALRTAGYSKIYIFQR